VIASMLLGASPPLAAIEIEFASVDEARTVLGARDEFVARLSPFDRAGRLQSGDAVSEAEYLDFVGQSPRQWTRNERERIEAAFAAIEPALTALLPDLEEPVLMIKTSGAEEGGAQYTRGNAVILPEASLGNPARVLKRQLAHEIFHIVSRRNPVLKRALYAVIGFDYCGEVAHPASLAARRITNPDAPINDHCIRLALDDGEAWAVPILYSREPRYDADAGGPFFQYLAMAGPARAVERDGEPVLVPIAEASGFLEQVGRNTDYILHPEEILASNFQLLAVGEDAGLPSPQVLADIRRVLEEHAD
jgi:hypothetical protein